MAPAFLVRIDGDTTKVENIATAQGDWVYDKKSKRKSMIAKNIRDAHLKGEPIDHSLLKNAQDFVKESPHCFWGNFLVGKKFVNLLP